MFGSEALEVGIGLIFIYLVLSLSVTASTEVLAALFRLRARVLRNSIINFLTDGPAGAFERLRRAFNPFARKDKHALANKLYDHPLLQTLQASKHGPSYVPARTFALALIDVLNREPTPTAAPASAPAAANTPAPPASSEPPSAASLGLPAAWTEAVTPEVLQFVGKLKGQSPLLYDGLRTLVGEAVMDLELPGRHQAAGARLELAALEGKIREAADRTVDAEVKSALLEVEKLQHQLRAAAERSLIEPARVNMAMLREKIEVWFNGSMDQVSGWYKRWARFISFAVGIALVFPLNADTLSLADALSQDDDLRQAIVEQATTFSEENPPAAQAAQPAAAADTPLDSLQARYDRAVARQAELDATLLSLQDLGLPLGWQEGRYACWASALFGDESEACGGEPFADPWTKFFGLLITVFALTLGAPFWFDILNKVVNVRADAASPREVPRAPEAYPKREENIPPQ